ncbi:putative C6 transcription factor [Penicillium brasilianum]|uniref:Putative C6 transcription factor n=1 Tax=Penicillium brasilianum TaxID=104259 RepID=A0A1S9RFU2_PENBI|nr:putative C6 transcription factor [Penicillium brasilianum]
MYPHPKRRRLTGDVLFPTELDNAPGLSPPPAFAPGLNSDWTLPQRHAPAYTPSDSTDVPAFPSPLGAASWGQDGFSHDPGFLASQEELRCMLFTIAQSAAPTRAASPDGNRQDDEEEDRLTERDPLPMRSALSSSRRVEYLKNYVGQVAPWLDMFDSQCTFRVQIPALARTFPALLNAILAISARQMERKEGIQDSFDSIELYQEAIRLLSPLLQMRDPKVIAACVLLCCLEMMSARAQDWRRHLEGCTALFDAFEINGFSSGLLQAVFWCYVRMDLCGALISDGTQSTLLRPSKWLAPDCPEEDAAQLFQAAQSPDMHANYAVYLCAKTCELVADRTQFLELGAQNDCTGDVYQGRWLRLWDDLQQWVEDRPPELLPVQTTQTKPFPHILFLHWAAISSNQLYHTACILLLNIMPKSIKLRSAPIVSALWHARRICGISLANPHQGCLNNAIQPLWIAGRLFSHVSEHAIIIDIIRKIEAETGWGACWRIRDLELAWGYQLTSRSRKSGTQNSPVAG